MALADKILLQQHATEIARANQIAGWDNNGVPTSVNQTGGNNGEVQYKNGNVPGGITGSNWNGSILTLPSNSSPAASGKRLKLTSENWQAEFCSYYNTYAGGALVANVFDAGNVPVSSTFILEILVLATQTSGTKAATAFSMKVRATFKVDAAGLITLVGSSVQEWVSNDTGDAFSGTPALAASGSANVNFNLNLTTTKTFALSVWSKAIVNS